MEQHKIRTTAEKKIITTFMSTDPTAACKGQELGLKGQFTNILFLLEI